MQALSSFGDTASHLPDCCSLHALVSDAEGPYLNRLSQQKSLRVPDISPRQAGPLSTSDPERELTPCSRQATLGTQIGLGWGRQNERDRAMVEDPPTDLEEVVVGIRSLGSIPRPVGKPRDGSSV